MILHSHMDAGWLKTPDEYFTGEVGPNIHAASKTILDSVLDEVSRDPRRRFSIADIKFLNMWLKTLSKE